MNDEPLPPLLAALRWPHSTAAFGLPQWEQAILQARRANLLGRLAHRIEEELALDGVPPAPRAHLIAASRLAAAQADAVRREVGYVRKALAKSGLEIVLLKGAAYAMAGLPPARGRMFSDIDILVPFERIAEAEVALRLHGWVTTHYSAYDQRYYREWMHELPPMRHAVRTTVVDVHHAILPRTARLKPSSAKLLAAAQPIAGEERLRVLAPADMVLHSATHLFHNEELGQGLRDLGDLDSLLRHFGARSDFWEGLPERADELDLTAPLRYGLRQAARWFGTPVPEATRERLETRRPAALPRKLVDALYDRALAPADPSRQSPPGALARQALFVRAHWLRMPLHLLAWHLTAKLLRIDREPPPAAARDGG